MKRFALVMSSALLVLATACSPAAAPSGGASAGSGSAAGDKKVVVYTSTNVWGSVAKAVGGQHVDVQSSVSKPDQDPHDYEATAQDKATVSKASVAIVNGGGYDDWAVKLLEGSKAPVINAVELSGLKKEDEKEFNEHVFYSLDSVKKVADKTAEDLAKADAAHAADYTANAQAFDKKLDDLKTKAKAVGDGKGLTAFATEPVTGYLMADMGIQNATPDEFVEQSETDAGPSTKVQAEAQELIKAGKAKLLVLNAQTETDVTKGLAGAATGAKVPVVKVTETFPDGVTEYDVWVQRTIDDFQAAAKQVK